MRRIPWHLLMFVWGILFVWFTPGLGRTAQLLSLASSVVPLLAAGAAQRGVSLRGVLGLSLGVALLFALCVLHGQGGTLQPWEDAWVSARLGALGLAAYAALFALSKRCWQRYGIGLALLLDGSVGFVPGLGMLFPRLHLLSLLGPKSVHFQSEMWSGAALWLMVLGYGWFGRQKLEAKS